MGGMVLMCESQLMKEQAGLSLLARQVTTVLLFIVLDLHMAKVRILRVGAAVVMDGSVQILIFHLTVARL